MDFKSILSKKEEEKEYFWSIIIEPEWIQAGLWSVEDKRVRVVSRSVPLAWGLDEELVNAGDSVLSGIVQELEEDIGEPSKAVFGVVSSWVTDGQIKEEHLAKIKLLCSDLSLKPVGFVVMSEAIANFIKSEEKVALTGITLGLMKEQVEVSVFKQGELVGSTEVSRSVSLTDDVVEGLTRIVKEGELPSRMILFDGKEGEIEDSKQVLIQANWDSFENIKFLHTPKIESISVDEKVDAVCLAGAVDIAGVSILEKEAISEETETNLSQLDESSQNIEDLSPEELGFALNVDIGESENEIEYTQKEEIENVVKQPVQLPEKKEKIKRKISFAKLAILGNIFKKRPKIRASSATSAKKALILGGIFLLLLIVGGFILWWFYPKATVTLYISTSALDERVTVSVDPNASNPNFSESVLPGQVVTSTISGEKSIQTTGTKTVGDKAKGEVVLYRVGSSIDLEAGDTISSTNGLDFTLDDDIKIASGSASSPGKATAKVTAEDIGSEYNLSEGTTFEVANYSLSDIEAKNESSFSGGSSREISAVSQSDQDKLEKSLDDELKDKALAELAKKIEGSCENCVLIDESYTSETTDSDYSAKVGDEASNVKLTLSKNTKAIAANKDDLINFSRELLNDRVPDGYVLREDQVKVDFKFKEEVGGIYKMDATVTANLFPQINPDDVVDKIVGKYPQLAEDYFVKEIPGFVRAEINLRPKLRGRLRTLPHVTKNIEIEIAAER